MNEVISLKLTNVIVEAQLDKPRNMITGTSNWACYIAGRIQLAYPSKSLANTTTITQDEVRELIRLANELEQHIEGPAPSGLSTTLHALLLRATEDASDAPIKD